MSSSMRLLLFFIVGLVVYAAVAALWVYSSARKSGPLVSAAVPYGIEDPQRTKHVLVIGDSTAVGVGSAQSDTVAARLGTLLDANVENVAVSGAQTSDLPGQIARAKRKAYDMVLVQIGANDVMRFKNLSLSASNLKDALNALTPLSSHIAVLTAGDIGSAPLWPFPLNALYSYRTRTLRDMFTAVTKTHGALYIDIYAEGDMFSNDPSRYYAQDNLHLTGDGYGKWFSVIERDIRNAWPDLL